MRLLLDTHIFLWSLSDVDRLTTRVRQAIEDSTNSVFVSSASTWEIAIKWRAGRLELPLPPDDMLPTGIARSHFEVLPISVAHTLAAANLPMHHSDPFDRMLIAQAMIENATLVTVDQKIMHYTVQILA